MSAGFGIDWLIMWCKRQHHVHDWSIAINILMLFAHIWDVICVSSNADFCKQKPAESPVAQMADIGFKVVLLERLNQKWKQKHF